jgi:hypothetical protein
LAGIWSHDHSQHIGQRNLPSAVAGFRVLEAPFGAGFTLRQAARLALREIPSLIISRGFLFFFAPRP